MELDKITRSAYEKAHNILKSGEKIDITKKHSKLFTQEEKDKDFELIGQLAEKHNMIKFAYGGLIVVDFYNI